MVKDIEGAHIGDIVKLELSQRYVDIKLIPPTINFRNSTDNHAEVIGYFKEIDDKSIKLATYNPKLPRPYNLIPAFFFHCRYPLKKIINYQILK